MPKVPAKKTPTRVVAAAPVRPVTHPRQLSGVVVRVGNKTIYVRVERVATHPKYHKQYLVHNTFAAHDEKQTATIGANVVVQQCRPISKTKKWRLVEIVRK